MTEVPQGSRRKIKPSIAMLRDRIAYHLIVNNRSQSQLAGHLGVSRSWVSKLMRGRRDMVSMWYLDEIAQYFGIEIATLFTPVPEASTLVRDYLDIRPGARLREIHPRQQKGLGARPRGKHHVIVEADRLLRTAAKSGRKIVR